MPLRLLLIGAAAVNAVAALGCTENGRPFQPLGLQVVVEADEGHPIEGVVIRLNGEPVGSTDSQGRLSTSVRARTGETLHLVPECPDGYSSPTSDRLLKVRQYDPGTNRELRVVLVCKPHTRIAAFLVRAKRGPGVVVRVDGTVVARVNGHGFAAFTRSAAPGTQMLVELDAREQTGLVPPLLSRSVEMPEGHEVFVIDADFELRIDRSKLKGPRRRITKIE